MSFDPSTAVLVEEPVEFDPSTATPIEESRLLGQFDPSTAAPMSRDEEINLVKRYLSPDYVAQSKEEFAQLRKLENELKDQGAIPGDLENAAKAVGGMFVSMLDAAGSLASKPLDSWRRSPATIQSGVGMAALSAMEFGGFVGSLVRGKPTHYIEQTGEFLFQDQSRNPIVFERLKEKGLTARPTSEDDLLEYDYQQYIAQKGIEAETLALESKTAPTEFVTSLFTGTREETPNVNQAKTVSILADPFNLAPGFAGTKVLGASRAGKLVSSKAARALEKSAYATADGIDNVSQAVIDKIQDITGLTEKSQKTAATVAATGAGLAGGTAMFMSDADPATKTALTTAATVMPLVFRYGAATLRKVGSGAGQAKIILREAADATNGLDQAARAAVIANPAVPQVYKDILENPTRFRPIESTPARLAADPRLGKQTRAIMDRLSNPLIVQGVRGASAVAGGAVKGSAVNAPFAAIASAAGEDDDAATMLLGGAAFGAAGGAIDRVTGVKQRRAEARDSDIARLLVDAGVERLLVDTELVAGDVGKLVQTYSPQQLGDLASMQGFFRDKVDFVPLDKADFDLNTQALGGAGAAGLFVQAPPGEKARIFINLDAKREGIVPHELGHALIKSGALGGMQADSIRAFTTRRYTQAGVEARAREYATTLIQNENAAKFPGQNLPISQDAIQAKMDELGQSGLLRGDTDPLDWARDEIFAEDFRQASQSMDFAAIRRNLPAEGSWLGMFEGILGAQANALSIAGVRIDPVTGQPDPLFKNNPILATDPVLKKQLGQYLNNYRQWINHPDQTKARGVRVAPAARPQDLVNNPLVTFHDYGGGVLANEFARVDPATGQVVLRDQRDINAATALRQEQMRTLVGSKAISPKDPVLGPKKIQDENGRSTGRTTTRGRLLPKNFDFLNGFAQHQRGFARQLETAAANGESLMVRYHAIGTSDSGSFRVKNLGNLEAITREVIPWGWELTSKGNLLASVLDLTQFRNRALKAINAGDPTIGRLYNNDLKAIEADLKQWMENHRQDLPGSNKIGEQRRDAINSLIGIATNVNKGANPFAGKIAGPGSAIKSFRLDRLDAATGTGRTGFHFDYEKANGNLLPEVPTPLPDLSRDLPTPKGQAMLDAMPDKISGALPRRGATVSGKAEVSNDGTLTYNGKEPSTWTPEDFAAFGREFGVRNLGPLTKVANIVDELGRPVAQIPGGLDGTFTYYDLLWLKANPVNVKTLPVDLHGQLTAKLARTMTPEKGNKVQKFNGILFGMLSPNSPLLPNEFGQARMRFESMEEIKKFADLLPDNPTKEQRKAVNNRLKKELGFTSAKSGGLGIGISVDLSNTVMAAKMFVKNPDFFIKKPKESWANFVDKLTTQVSGLGTKTASFGGVWQDPLNAGISAMDRHMARAFSEELLNNPDIRGRFEGIVVKRFNDLIAESKATARKADAKIRRAQTPKAKEKAQQAKALAMQNLPDPTALKAETLDDVLGQAEIFGADRVKDFVNEAVFAAMGSRKAKYQMKDGSVNPNLPASIQGVQWVQTPKDFQVMSEAYRLALDINAKRAKSIGIEIFPAQWTLWDGIRGRVEPHEAMFPGLEKLPALNDRQLASAFAANKKAGYASTPAPGQPWKRKSGINPAELAYFGIPFAAAAMSQQDEE